MATKLDTQCFYYVKHTMKPAMFWNGRRWATKDEAKVYDLENDAWKDALLYGGVVFPLGG
ncbi:MAG: hypothetical protein JWM68_2399 [Verrucomicrobiales bacterium]|nr:hypothetical protein [Verrucomicrobiales bacterium]